MTDRIRAQPCEFCPYRRDVPSGVWSATDYEKLPPYDEPTGNQPLASFACHATPAFDCHGWAVVHSNRGPEHELLALRLQGSPDVPEPAVPLFDSGAGAAAHGMRDIEAPGDHAVDAQAKLLMRYSRLRTAGINLD